jgi:CBS domain-containing protein
MIDMNTALQAELGDVVNQIDNMTYDEQDASGLIKIKQQQVVLAENMLDRNVYPGDISYLLSFLNNVIYRRAIRLAEKRVAEKNIIKKYSKFFSDCNGIRWTDGKFFTSRSRQWNYI